MANGEIVWCDGTNVLVELTTQGYHRVLYDRDCEPVFTTGLDAVCADVRRNAPDVMWIDLVTREVRGGRLVYVRAAHRAWVTPPYDASAVHS